MRDTKTRFQLFWDSEVFFQIIDINDEEIHFCLKIVFMVGVRFGVTTNDRRPAGDAICEDLSPLGYKGKRLTDRVVPNLSLVTTYIRHSDVCWLPISLKIGHNLNIVL